MEFLGHCKLVFFSQQQFLASEDLKSRNLVGKERTVSHSKQEMQNQG